MTGTRAPYADEMVMLDALPLRSPNSRPLDRALIMLAVVAAALGGIQLALVLPGSGDIWWVHVLFMAVFWTYMSAGILAWHRRPNNRIGALIVVGGFMVFAASLANTTVPGAAALGAICSTVVLAVTVHLLLAFPSGRLRDRASLVTVIAAYVVSVVLQAPLYLFDPGAPPPLGILDRPDLLLLGTWMQRVAGLLVVVSTATILTRRLRHADAARRRVLVPLFAYGMLTVVAIPVRSILLEGVFGVSPLAGAVVQLIILAGVPIAFVFGVLRGGFARTGALDELGAWLGSRGDARSTLAAALAQTLGDDSLEIVFWMSDQNAWIDRRGAHTDLPQTTGDRASVEVELAGRRIAAIIYDAALNGDPEIVRAAGRVIAIAAERERLLAELLASQDALLRSRTRLVVAADRERRRIAQDLHDGIQVQLVLLAVEAQQIADASTADLATTKRATRLRKRIDAAATELRELVHDVMPSTLMDHGLSAAVEDLVDRMPLPTKLHVDIDDAALPEQIESAAFFLISEGLVNALKYSQATSLRVALELTGDRLVVEVVDDGVGGADVGPGHGLRGLADRVDVVGGRLQITSPPGAGTRLRAELPCAL